MSNTEEVIGSIDALWRYPVKSMRGQTIEQAFIGYAGIYGDRLYAFKTSAGPSFFPYLTGRETQDMLLYTPRFRHPEKAEQPINWAEAEALSVGITPVFSSAHELAMDIAAPNGELYAIDDPALAQQLAASAGDDLEVSLTHSQRAMTDCRPLSLISLQTKPASRLIAAASEPIFTSTYTAARALAKTSWSVAVLNWATKSSSPSSNATHAAR